jgi:GH18 family chitinase
VCAGGYAKFTGLKTYNKQLKTLLAIGGWNEGSTRFSPLVADEERRAELVHNVVRFLRQNHFDGLDLDWEYPAFRDGGKPRDRENYALLVQVFRESHSKQAVNSMSEASVLNILRHICFSTNLLLKSVYLPVRTDAANQHPPNGFA